MTVKEFSFFCSWSGGKDSCLAFYHAVLAGGKPFGLFTALREGGEYSGSHGLPASVIQRQAELIGVPLLAKVMKKGRYTEDFAAVLDSYKEKGVDTGVFGDIDVEEHRAWVEDVCSSAGIRPLLPLWQWERAELLESFLNNGFKAMIVSVRDKVMDKSYLGEMLDWQLVRELEKRNIDPLGERGEFHTVVTDGPLFSSPLPLQRKGQVFRDRYWFEVCE